MNNFLYYAPTRVIFGKDTEKEVGNLIKEFNGRKVLVHFGGNSAVKSGLLDRVCRYLTEAGLQFVKSGGVVPNPRLSKVNEGIELCKKEGVDFILAVGGGSVIDSAKAIGYGLTNEGDVWDIYLKKRPAQDCTPVGCILTISATGSEMSDSSVITNEEGAFKRGYSNNLSRPKFAIMNPALTLTLPWYQAASGAVDIIMHTLERWFDSGRTSTQLTDAIATGLIKTVMDNILILRKNPGDYDAAAELMWAGSLSHNGLTHCGGTPPPTALPGDWACHQIEHELGGMFDVAHGAGISAVWGSWARYICKEKPERFVKFGRDLFGIQSADPLECINKMEDFFVAIDMPKTVAGLGVSLNEETIKELAYKCNYFGTRKIGGYRPLSDSDIENILRMAKG